jgi:hypothetical protein
VSLERATTAVMLLLAALACGPRLTREQKVELLRAQYTASLESLVVNQDPVSAPPVVRADAVLDIRVSTTAEEYLPGVTVDIEHVDAQRRHKDRDTVWVDTSTLVRGEAVTVTRLLENVDWDTGDGFSVEVRRAIPAEDRAAYKEFGGDS